MGNLNVAGESKSLAPWNVDRVPHNHIRVKKNVIHIPLHARVLARSFGLPDSLGFSAAISPVRDRKSNLEVEVARADRN